MLAFALSLLLIVFWFGLGFGILVLIVPEYDRLRRLLLAPSVGLAANVMAIFWLSRTGLPVQSFAWWLMFTFCAGTVAILWRRRIAPDGPAFTPFALVLLGAAVLSGWPLFIDGFDWISFCNDDMANYALGAKRFMQHGFFDLPDIPTFLAGRDYSLPYWFQTLVERAGSELLLSWVAALTGLSAIEIFMPVILALHVTLICTAGALVFASSGNHRAAFLTCGLAALSALTTLGTLYQLLGQATGLILLAGSLAAFPVMTEGLTRSRLLRLAALQTLLLSALLVCYPEVAPFYAAAIGLSQLLQFREIRAAPGTTIMGFMYITAGVLFLLGRYLFCAGVFLLSQMSKGMQPAVQNAMLFPYFMLPSGLSSLWGLQNAVTMPPEPWLSLGIVLGSALTLAVLAGAIALAARTRQLIFSAICCLFLAGGVLFFSGNAFGVYKIAMYAQPFLWGALALIWLRIADGRKRWLIPLLGLGVLSARTQFEYVARSRGVPDRKGIAFCEIYNATRGRVNDELRALLAGNTYRHLVFDTSNLVLAKLQAYHAQGIQSYFPLGSFFHPSKKKRTLWQGEEFDAYARKFIAAGEATYQMVGFVTERHGDSSIRNGVRLQTGACPARREDAASFALVVSPAQLSLMNRRMSGKAAPSDFAIVPWNQAINHLLFIDSLRGPIYFAEDRRNVALFQLEPDYFFPGDTMAGLGRHFVFQVINPTPAPRLVLSVTRSYAGDGDNCLPPAGAIGQERRAFDVAGRGSARLFSPPLEPQQLSNRMFLGLDMGMDGRARQDRRYGLMRLFGNKTALDFRRLTCHGRDISLISEQEYAALPAPARIASFPGDLGNKALEYSGIYEDGWLSEDAYAWLRPHAQGDDILVLEAMLPAIGGATISNTCTLSINSHALATRTIPPGRFTLTARIPPVTGRIKTGITFSRLQSLPGGDDRPVAAKLIRLGIEPCVADGQDIVDRGCAILPGRNWHECEKFNGEIFRWITNDAELLFGRLSDTAHSPTGAASTGEVMLIMDVAPGPGIQDKPFELEIRDESGEVLHTATVAHRMELVISFQKERVAGRSIFLHGSQPGSSTPGDPRILNFRVFRILCLP